MQRSASPAVLSGLDWLVKVAVGFAVVYPAAYIGLRWQHVLVRTTHCYGNVGEDFLRSTSSIGEGFRYGDHWTERLKEVMSPAAAIVFTPLAFAESEFRNRWMNVVK